MRILGLSGDGVTKKYICEINHTEIEKFLGLYYDNMKKLNIGDEVNLGKGYDYHRETKAALEKTQEFFKSHTDVIRAITNGLLIINKEEQ